MSLREVLFKEGDTNGESEEDIDSEEVRDVLDREEEVDVLSVVSPGKVQFPVYASKWVSTGVKKHSSTQQRGMKGAWVRQFFVKFMCKTERTAPSCTDYPQDRRQEEGLGYTDRAGRKSTYRNSQCRSC